MLHEIWGLCLLTWINETVHHAVEICVFTSCSTGLFSLRPVILYCNSSPYLYASVTVFYILYAESFVSESVYVWCSWVIPEYVSSACPYELFFPSVIRDLLVWAVKVVWLKTDFKWTSVFFGSTTEACVYRVIHKSFRDFRTRLRNNQDRHGRKEHINR